MGFRTTRYGPSTTNFFGGSIGAGVPLPRSAKPQNAVTTYSAAPVAIRNNPSTPAPRKSGRTPCGSSQYGIATVQNPGTIIVKMSVRKNGDIGRSVHPFRYERFRSRSPSGRTTSIRRPRASMPVQISSASGISNSPPRVSTTSSGVPDTPSPIDWTSVTLPSNAGAVANEQGEEATGEVSRAHSKTEHPIKSEIK